jgi:hypothetical protein
MAANPNETSTEYQLIGPSDDGKINDLLFGMNARDSRQRLQALIAEWLRMENLVVLAGAGTSVSAGGKTMANLENEVLGTIKAMPGLSPNIGTVLDERRAVAPTNGTKKIGFENWLSYLVNASFIASAPASPFSGVQWRGAASPTQKELSSFISNIGGAIFAECALTLPDSETSGTTHPKGSPHLAFLAKLVARDSNLGRAHLFTLNYDTLFEQALELLGFQYFD